ncbi:MAG: hypothetical protein WC569_06120 [Candidatus Omnitrophota bacterium]
MEEKSDMTIRDDFHSMNNWLNKITTSAGMARYHLEKNGIDVNNIEQEKAKLIKLLDEMEENAMKIGDALKKLRKGMDSKG